MSSAKKALALAENWNVVTHSELCLVLIEAFRQRYHYETTERDVKKKIGQRLFQHFVISDWVLQAMEWISSSIAAHDLSHDNAVQLLSSLLRFIGEHTAIQNAEHLRQLLVARNVDLPALLDQVSNSNGDQM